MADKDELFKGIDEAANSLFDQYIVKSPEAESNAANTPEPESNAAPVIESAAEPSLELDLEFELKSDTATTSDDSSTVTTSQASPEPVQEKPAEATGPAVSGAAEKLFGELEESLLTIDWEVNHANIAKGRDLLTKLVTASSWTATSPVGQVTTQMDKVLASMLESPENSPTSAPSQLKNALQAIKEARNEGGSSDANLSKQLEASLTNLQALTTAESDSASLPSNEISDDLQAATPIESITPSAEEPSFDLGLEMSIEAPESQKSLGETVPEATISVLRAYAMGISEAIRLLTPMENLFASRSTMAKLHSAAIQLKTKLSSQQELLADAFTAGYSSYNSLGTVHGWLGTQLDILKGCASRIGKLEKLFGKTAGYEKLFTRSKKIRQVLEKHVDAITIAVGGTPTQHQFDLTGEYPAIIQPAHQDQEAPAAAVSAVAAPDIMVDKCISLAKSIEHGSTPDPQKAGLKIRETLEKLKIAISGSAIHSPSAAAAANAAASVAGHSSKCRWDWLLKTSWGGQLVGLAPEQVVFESKSTFSANSFHGQNFFRLKKLKSMPWSKLRNMFSGDLAELENSELNNMELEIANPPASFPGSPKKKVYMTILYSEGKGKIYLLDSPTEAISVAEEALWAPGTSQSDIAGTLTVYGSTMPVISID